MPRRPNTRPTLIYWLLDVRPETLRTYPSGRPFYCGKTAMSVKERLNQHRGEANMRRSHRPVLQWIRACGRHVKVRTVEVVPVGGDWAERERRWIWVLRAHFPGCANASDGGQGAVGYIHTAEARAKMSERQKGKPKSPRHAANIRRGIKRRLGPKGIKSKKQKYAILRARHVLERQRKLAA